jgi:unsaturated rhamnogalacturonyl hydrolase
MKRSDSLLSRSILLSVLLAVAIGRAADAPLPREFAGAAPLYWSVRMADSEMARRAQKLVYKEGGRAKWDYSAGLFAVSLIELGDTLKDPRYAAFAGSTVGSFVAPDGRIQTYVLEDYSLDNIGPGRTVLALFGLTKEERYMKAAHSLRKQLDVQPRTSDGGFWHKQRYPQQMWLDGLYMAEPFYAEYTQRFKGPTAGFDDVAKQFRLIATHTFDPKTGLFFHGWDESRTQRTRPPAHHPISGAARSVGMRWRLSIRWITFRPTTRPGRRSLRRCRRSAPELSNTRMLPAVSGTR